jgi:histidine triad (HIT) family protein
VSPADPTCTVCRIVTGALDAHIVLDDPRAVAFLDHRPLFPGHTLVVPRDHVVSLPDLPGDELAPFFGAVQRVAAAIPAVLDAVGTFVAANNIVSQSVPHLHFHVVPRRPKDGLRGFFWPRHRYETPEEMADVAERLRRRLQHP